MALDASKQLEFQVKQVTPWFGLRMLEDILVARDKSASMNLPLFLVHHDTSPTLP
jgi:hypothetical protein